MTTRTSSGSLYLTDTFTPDHTLIIRPGGATISFLATDQGSDQRAQVTLDSEGLDQLAAEILRIREANGF